MVEISQEQLDELLGMKEQMTLMQAHIEELESKEYFRQIEEIEKEKQIDIEFEYQQYRLDKQVRLSDIQKFHRTLAKQKQEGVPEAKRIGWNPDNLDDDGGS